MIEENLFVIKSIEEYLSVIKNISCKEESTWFRGQSNASFNLIPSGLRTLRPIEDIRGNEITDGQYSRSEGDKVTGLNIDRIFARFKEESLAFMNCKTPSNDFEWLFLMQHYGAPTRLLDWSTNSLVGLYFAMPDSFTIDEESGYHDSIEDEFLNNGISEKGAAVFIINPNKINDESIAVKINGKIDTIKEPIDLNLEKNIEFWKYYLKPMQNGSAYSPICIIPPHKDQRMVNQSSVFTLHGSNIWSLDYYTVFKPLIYKIFIPYRYISEIKAELRGRDITHKFIYPGLDGLCKTLHEEENYLFTKKYT